LILLCVSILILRQVMCRRHTLLLIFLLIAGTLFDTSNGCIKKLVQDCHVALTTCRVQETKPNQLVTHIDIY
jgi:hypothetical protein